MNRLTKWLRGLRTHQKTTPPAAPVSVSWTWEDKEHWSRWLSSDSGKKLVARLRAFESANALAGAQDVLHTSHSAGRTVGYSDAIKHLLSLSCSCDVQRENAIGAHGAAPADETPARTEAREIAELLGRMSP